MCLPCYQPSYRVYIILVYGYKNQTKQSKTKQNKAEHNEAIHQQYQPNMPAQQNYTPTPQKETHHPKYPVSQRETNLNPALSLPSIPQEKEVVVVIKLTI